MPFTLVEQLSLIRVSTAATILMLLWMLETVLPFAANRRHRGLHGIRNLALAAINAAVVYSSVGLTSAMIAELTIQSQIGLLQFVSVKPGLQFLLAFLTLDAWTYFWHRANHRIPFLWRFHRVHHSDAEMDVTTSARFHTGEIAMAAILRLPLIMIFGLSPAQLIVHETVLVAVSEFHHANISLGRWDRVVRWLVVTPGMHRIHHSRRMAETNSNYASILSVWDRLFGSHVVVDSDSEIPLGLDEFAEPHLQTINGMLKTPFVDAASKPTTQESQSELTSV